MNILPFALVNNRAQNINNIDIDDNQKEDNQKEDNQKEGNSNNHICRICFEEIDSLDDPLISPCMCKGNSKYIHRSCLQKWRLVNPVDSVQRNKCMECQYNYNIIAKSNSISILYKIGIYYFKYAFSINIMFLSMIYIISVCFYNSNFNIDDNYYLFNKNNCALYFVYIIAILTTIYYIILSYKLKEDIHKEDLQVIINTNLILPLFVYIVPLFGIILYFIIYYYIYKYIFNDIINSITSNMEIIQNRQ